MTYQGYQVYAYDDSAQRDLGRHDDRDRAERLCRQTVADGADTAHVMRARTGVVYRVDRDELPGITVDYRWRAYATPLDVYRDGVRYAPGFTLRGEAFPVPLFEADRVVGAVTGAAVVDGWLTATGTVHGRATRDGMRDGATVPVAVLTVTETQAHDENGLMSFLAARVVAMRLGVPPSRWPGARFEIE